MMRKWIFICKVLEFVLIAAGAISNSASLQKAHQSIALKFTFASASSSSSTRV